MTEVSPSRLRSSGRWTERGEATRALGGAPDVVLLGAADGLGEDGVHRVLLSVESTLRAGWTETGPVTSGGWSRCSGTDPYAAAGTPYSACGGSSPALSGVLGARLAAAISCAVTFCGWWQAARWPRAYSVSCGSTLRQISVARGQRVWKRQPDGGRIGLGGSPPTIGRSRERFSSGSGIGIAPSSALV